MADEPDDLPARRLVRRQRVLTDFLTCVEEEREVELLRTARAVALAGLPKKRTDRRDLSRTIRLGERLWLRVTYSATEGNELPFGEDRFVLAGVQHLALEQQSPVVLFQRVGELLALFGLSQDGRTLQRLRERFARLAGLSVRLLFAESEAELAERATGEQIFIIRSYRLPTRRDLLSEEAGQALLPILMRGDELAPYGVKLSGDFWDYLRERRNQLALPLPLLRLFVDRPAGWDLTMLLWHRGLAARSTSLVPQDALMSLFRDSASEPERNVIARLRGYLKEIRAATGGAINASMIEVDPIATGGRGRPRKRWALKIGPTSDVESLVRPRRRRSPSS